MSVQVYPAHSFLLRFVNLKSGFLGNAGLCGWKLVDSQNYYKSLTVCLDIYCG